MVSIAFDTHRAVKELQEAGFDEAQAEAVVSTLGKAVSRDFVTKSEIQDLVSRPELQDFATKADIAEVKADIEQLKMDVAQLKIDIAALETRLTTKMGVAIASATVVIIAVQQLFA